jgi:hypothetical protein
VITSGCQVVTRVTVTEHAAGDGQVSVSVTLDHQAADQVPGLAGRLHVADLRKAGWVVVGPTPTADGGQSISASHAFADSRAEQAVMAEVSGEAGPFHGLTVQRRRSLLKTRTEVSGPVDLRRGVDALADPALAARLGVPSLAAALSALHAAGGTTPDLRVEVVARLPGRANRTWTVPLGQTTVIIASSEQWNLPNVILAAVSVLAALGFLVLVVARLLGAGRGEWEIGRRRADHWSPPRRRR